MPSRHGFSVLQLLNQWCPSISSTVALSSGCGTSKRRTNSKASLLRAFHGCMVRAREVEYNQ